jgi:hypothetical protein
MKKQHVFAGQQLLIYNVRTMRHVTLPNHIIFKEVKEMIAADADVTLLTKGNSMLPFIIGGEDSVILRKVDTLNCGDIVLAELPGEHYVLHRIINIDGTRITLMGDGNIRGTESCNTCDIIAKAITILHNGKQIDCNSRSQLIKAQIWHKLRPIRRYLLAIYRRL